MAAGDITVTVIGNLTNDPELRFTPSGAAVASFTVASSSRVLDKTTNEWKDGDTVFMRCSVWRQYAENVAESLTKGTRVIVSGRLKQRSYETREGEKRTVMELEVEDVGPALRYATAKVNRVQRQGGGYGEGAAGDAEALLRSRRLARVVDLDAVLVSAARFGDLEPEAERALQDLLAAQQVGAGAYSGLGCLCLPACWLAGVLGWSKPKAAKPF